MVNENQVFIVLGMHRSGTSTITRSLKILGVELGDNLMPPLENNPKGFWEDLDINYFNIKVLRFLEKDWHHLLPLQKGELDLLIQEGFVASATKIIQAKLDKFHVFGFKDPRVSVLLPFWQLVFEKIKIKPNYILALRNPKSVVDSLYARDKLIRQKSYLLWLSHTICSLKYSELKKLLVVEFDNLFKNLNHETQRIAEKFNLKVSKTEQDQFSCLFLDNELKHHSNNEQDLYADACCPEIVCEVYEWLSSVASGSSLELGITKAKIDQWFIKWNSYIPLLSGFDELTKSNDELMKLNDSFLSELNQAKLDLLQMEKEKESQIERLLDESNKKGDLLDSLEASKKSLNDDFGQLLNAQMNSQNEIIVKEKNISLYRKRADAFIAYEKTRGQIFPYKYLNLISRLSSPLSKISRVKQVIDDAKSFNDFTKSEATWFKCLLDCPLFDENWYRAKYPDVASQDAMTPLEHYVKYGWRENRNPCFEFDSIYYLENYQDVLHSNIPPLYHYWRHGKIEKRKINAAFDAEWNARNYVSIDYAKIYSSAPKNNIEISVIIPTYNRINLLRSAISYWKKVHKNTHFSYEIIFSDDGSSDGSVDYLKSVTGLPIKVLKNNHGGASSARNAAIKIALGKRVLFLGDDIYPDDNLLNVHNQLGNELGDNTAILGKVDWHEALNVNHLMAHITEIGNEQFSYNRLVNNTFVDFRHFYTCNISVPRALLLREKKLFDLSFNEYGFEDIELGYRLAINGMSIYYTEQAFGSHDHPYNVEGFCRRQQCAGRMSVVFTEIHPGLIDFLSLQVPDKKYIDQEALWKTRLKQLISRCESYEKIIVKLHGSNKDEICNILSLLYSHLFRAMYEYGYLTKKCSNKYPLTIAMSRNFHSVDPKYWSLIDASTTAELDALSGDKLEKICEAIATNKVPQDRTYIQAELLKEFQLLNSLDSSYLKTTLVRHGFFQIVSQLVKKSIKNPGQLFEELKQIFQRQFLKLNYDRKGMPDNRKQRPKYLEVSLAVVLDKDTHMLKESLALLDSLPIKGAVYIRYSENQVRKIERIGNKGAILSIDMIKEAIVFWPETVQAFECPTQIFNCILSLIENNLDITLFSSDLDFNGSVRLTSLRNASVFTIRVFKHLFSGSLSGCSLQGKVLRLLPAPSDSSEVKFKDLFGDEVKFENDGFFKKGTLNQKHFFRKPYFLNREKKKQTVFVFPIFLAVGRVERNTVEIMRQLSSQFEFVVITMERLSPEQGSLAGQAIEVASSVIEMSEIIQHKQYLGLLSRLKDHYEPDLVWVCNGSPWFCDNAKPIRELFKDVPIIDQEVYDVNHGWINRYDDPGIQSFDQFIAINKKIEGRFISDFKIDSNKTSLIYSAINTPRIKEFSASEPCRSKVMNKHKIPNKKRVFTFMARLTQQKQPLKFLEIALRHKEKNEDLFLMVGNGELDADVKSFIEKHSLNNVVRIPYVENTLEIHSISDGIVFTSAFEGLPIAMLEALAMGVPVFSTDVGDIKDILEEYNAGSVVSSNLNIEETYDAFINWAEHQHQYRLNLNKNTSHILDRFSSQVIASEYVNSWSKAMSQYGKDIACEV